MFKCYLRHQICGSSIILETQTVWHLMQKKKNFKEYNLQIASKMDELLALNILLIKWRLSLEFGECLEGFSSFKTWKHFPCLKFVMSTMCKLLIPYELNISKFCKSQILNPLFWIKNFILCLKKSYSCLYL